MGEEGPMRRWLPFLAAAAAAGRLRPLARGDGVVRLSTRTIHTAEEPRRADPLFSGRDHYLLLFAASAPIDVVSREVGASFAAAEPHYVPPDAWVVYAAADEVAGFESRGGGYLQWWGRLEDDDHVDPALAAELRQDADSTLGGSLVVVVAVGADVAAAARRCAATADGCGYEHRRAASAVARRVAAELAGLGVKVHAAAVAADRILVTCGSGDLRVCVGFIAAAPETVWVTSKQAAVTHSVQTQWIVQSGEVERRPVWDHGIRGEGEIVAVGDTGLDYESCYFRDPLEPIEFYPNVSATHRKLVSVSSSDCECVENGAPSHGLPAPNGDSSDQVNGHGTFAAGIVAGLSDVDPSHAGMAPAARLVIQDLQDDSLPTALLRQLYPGQKLDERYFPQAFLAGARIQSSSWGSAPAPSLDDLDIPAMGGVGPRQAAQYGLYALDADRWGWIHKDMLMVFGAGNEGRRGARTVTTPGNAKNVLTVGALEVTGSGAFRQNVAYFSSTGPTYDGRVKPDIIAPATDVVSVYSDGPAGDNSQCPALTAHSGTSVSTPIVAGAAALLRQYLREGWIHTGLKDNSRGLVDPPAALLRAMLVASADEVHGRKKSDFDDPVGGLVNTTRPSWMSGYGALNLANVMVFDKPADPVYDVWFDTDRRFDNSSVAGSWYTWCWEVRDTGDKRPLRVALVWPDYPASLFAASALVTDLDLTVVNDDGLIWKGNGNIFTGYDDRNTVEAVEVQLPVPGRYQAFVSLKQPLIEAVRGSGGQPFSVVVAGPVSQNGAGFCPVRKCPGGCSGNGACVSSAAQVGSRGLRADVKTCQCAANNTGVDCSIPACTTGAAECSGHGCYQTSTGTCLCHSDTALGFWTGATCGVCQSSHQGTGPAGTTHACKVDKFCSYHGNLVGNTAGNGSCLCQVSPTTGYWDGVSCERCLSGYHGLFCKCSSADCDSHGTCGDNGCTCYDDDARGHWSHHGVGTNCSLCKTGWYGPDCKCSHETCHGHGECLAGGCVCQSSVAVGRWSYANYTCNTCADGWTGPGCNCQTSVADGVCGGHGTCDTVAGCQCVRSVDFGYWACSDTGCTQGVCGLCDASWFGPSCRCSDAQCGGHGSCTSSGCACDASNRLGHWDVVDGTCSICKAGWFGPGCRCRTADCDGHGVCTVDGCQCYQTAAGQDPLKVGFFSGDGTRCSSCSPGWAVYPTCLCASNNCNGHGRCTLGGCDCYNNSVAGQGTWAPDAGVTNCLVCASGFSGDDCLCSEENCATLATSGEPVQRRVNFVNVTSGNETLLSGFDFFADTNALGLPGTQVETTFKRVDEGDSAHPRGAEPQDMVFLEVAFQWDVARSLVTATSSPSAAPAVQTQPPTSSPAAAGNASGRAATPLQAAASAGQSVTFEGFATFRVYFVHLATASAIRDQTAELMTRSAGVWQKASDTCDPSTRRKVVEQLQATAAGTSWALTTRVCKATSGSTYAVFAERYVEDTSWIFWVSAGGAFLVALSVAGALLYRVRKRLAREKRERAAKEYVIKFMQDRKDSGPPLRERLGLDPEGRFTPEAAAEIVASKLRRRRKMFERLMNRREYQQIRALTKAMVGTEIGGTSSDNVAALSRLTDGEKAVKKIWEFRDGELHLLEACRVIRGMFPEGLNPLREDSSLRPGVLPVLQQSLVEAHAENVKLRRLLLAMRKRESDGPSSVQRPMQTQLPSEPIEHQRVAHVSSTVLRDLRPLQQEEFSPLGPVAAGAAPPPGPPRS